MRDRVTGILLAAGESSRMGYPKPLLMVGDRTFLEHVAEAMLTAVPNLIVVLGAHAERIRPIVPRDPRVTIVENPNYKRGQLSSLKAALSLLSSAIDAIMVHLVDHPTVMPETYRGLIKAYRDSRQPIIISRFRARNGHPVIFDRSLFAELDDAPEDQGARAVTYADPSRVGYVDVEDPGVALDLDSPDDVRRAGLTLPSDFAAAAMKP